MSVRIELDRGEFEIIRQEEDRRPVLILAHSNECEKCKDWLVFWENLTAKFEKDRSIRTGVVNCSRDVELCDDIGVVSNECPKVVSWSEGQLRVRSLSTDRIEVFVEELRTRVIQERAFEAKLREISRPVFKFYFRDSDNEAREAGARACLDAGLLYETHFFFFTNNDIDEVVVQVLLEDNSTKIMKDKFTYENVRSFIADHRVRKFGKWKFDEIRGMKRLFGIYLAAPGGISWAQLKEWARYHEDDIWFGNLDIIGRRGCQAVFGVTKDMYPCVIVMNMRNLTFSVLEEVTNVRKLDRFLERYRDGVVTMTPFTPMKYRDYVFAGLLPYGKLAIVICVVSVGFGYLTRPFWTRIDRLLKDFTTPKAD